VVGLAEKQAHWQSGPTIATGLIGLAIVGMSLFALSPRERLTQRSVLKSVPGVRNSRQADFAAPTKPAAKAPSMNGKIPGAKPPADDGWSRDVTGASTGAQWSWYGRNADPLRAERPEWTAFSLPSKVPDTWSSDGWFGNFDPLKAERPPWDQLRVCTSCVEPKRTEDDAPAVETRELGGIDSRVSNAHPLSAFTVHEAFTEPDAFSSNVWFGNFDPLQAERPQWDQFSVRTTCVEPKRTGKAANDAWTSDGWFGNFDPLKAERPPWDQLRVCTSCVEPKRTEEDAPAVETRELGGIDSRVSNAHPLTDPRSALRAFTVHEAFTEPDVFASDGWFGNFDPHQAERPQWDHLSVRTTCRAAGLVS
jgi:hypothetical protein